ncbi:BsaA family SipW-dependent biofilm matrix protein [Candidatus Saccharibacteria bacterium]|nr:BsaA family SipW-dependent biofilm matrix protein [Candidatus Saccharibacteria bacterium]
MKKLINKIATLKNKRPIVFVCVLGAISFVIGGALAVSRDRANISNEFELADFRTVFTETFDSPENWLTCETVDKEITVKNESSLSSAVRVKLEEEWISSDGIRLPLVSNVSGNQMAVINFTENSHWTQDGLYYYYNDNLDENEETVDSLISGVTLNCDANLDEDTEYANATYHLTITAQAVEEDKKDEAWHTDYARLKTGSELNQIVKNLMGDNHNNPVVTQGVFCRGSVIYDSYINTTEFNNKERITVNESPYDIYVLLDRDQTVYWEQQGKRLVFYIDAEGDQCNDREIKYNSDMSYFNSGLGFSIDEFLRQWLALSIDYSEISDLSHFFDSSPDAGISSSFLQKLEGNAVDASYLVNNASNIGPVLDAITSFSDRTKIKNMNHMFADSNDKNAVCGKVGSDMRRINTSSAIDMSYLFGSLETCSIPMLANGFQHTDNYWDVSKVYDMSHMFEGLSNLTNVQVLNTWNVNSATDITDMFAGTSVTQFPTWYH